VLGAAVTLRHLQHALARDGHAVAVLVAADDRPPPDAESVSVRRADPRADLAAVAREVAADVVVVVTALEAAAAVESCRAAGMPCALYIQTVDMARRDLAFGDADVLHLTVSHFAAERLRARYGVSAAIVPPIVAHGAEEPDAPRDRILFVNPVPEKGCEIAFAVMRELPQVPFIVLESWPLTAAWRGYGLARAAAMANVDWRTPTDDMEAIWRRTRAVLMPSIVEETWGRVAGEAQARDIPVIGSTRGALPATIGAGGLLIDVHGPLDAWIAAVARLAGDNALHRRLAAAARDHAARTHARPEAAARALVAALGAHLAAGAA
jgi:glycosyltransferase involved in cell wall biosynthesis